MGCCTSKVNADPVSDGARHRPRRRRQDEMLRSKKITLLGAGENDPVRTMPTTTSAECVYLPREARASCFKRSGAAWRRRGRGYSPRGGHCPVRRRAPHRRDLGRTEAVLLEELGRGREGEAHWTRMARRADVVRGGRRRRARTPRPRGPARGRARGYADGKGAGIGEAESARGRAAAASTPVAAWAASGRGRRPVISPRRPAAAPSGVADIRRGEAPEAEARIRAGGGRSSPRAQGGSVDPLEAPPRARAPSPPARSLPRQPRR